MLRSADTLTGDGLRYLLGGQKSTVDNDELSFGITSMYKFMMDNLSSEVLREVFVKLLSELHRQVE